LENCLTVNKILEICNGELISGDRGLEVVSFMQDSREVKSGDIYVGIKGENTDGNDFYEMAFAKGAIGCMLQKLPDGEALEKYSDKVVIKVTDTIKALQELAKYQRSLYDIPVIGITGSVGKTSTKDMVSSVMAQEFNVCKTEGNYNNHIGLPLTLLKLKEHTAAVVEMGMNHLGEISILTDIAKPTVCVFTNIGTAHIGLLGSRENILKAKLEMLEGMKAGGEVIINNDNDLLHDWAAKNSGYNIHTYGIDNNSDYMAYNISQTSEGSIFNIDVDGKEYNIEVPVAGMHFVYNSLCAIAVGRLFNIEMESIMKGITELKLTAKRMAIEKIKDNITVINDSYNASYDSMKAALEVLKDTRASKRIAVLGEMRELGDFSKELHEKVGEEVAKNSIDILITVGKDAEYIGKKAEELGLDEIYFCEDKAKAVEILKRKLCTNDAILLKASMLMHFSEILDELKEW